MSAKNITASILVLIGFVVLGITFLKGGDQNGSEFEGHLDPKDHAYNPALITNYIDSTKSYDALALFVVADELCSSCINEIIEYAQAVKEYDSSPLNSFSVAKHGVIVGNDSTDYRRMNHLIKFPFSSSLLDKKSKLAAKIRAWKQDVSGINQIVLFDLREEQVVGRIGIFTSSTTPTFKKNLVQEAFYELEAKQNLN
ncbi:hypothetical protein [Fodinibius halophilus]|uniref:Thioredoxin domain-containing protein n=1 Tax=Fodinibius halophilus TaxID=1736908 RepID=A0A6M1T050_9BACT|nr:hypothetical protein [Fodinibius halophilus]NGP87289.1 hypothetical protein [Fodinibius halophilus]